MGQARNYEALIRELLAGVAGGWSYGNVIVLLMTKGVDETDLALWLRDFAEGLSLEQDWELIEQLKLLGKMTPGKLASEALMIAAKFDRSYEQNSELLNHEAWIATGIDLCEQRMYEEAIASYDRAIEINPDCYITWSNRGIALGETGRYEEAITSFNRAIEIDSSIDMIWFNRGITLCDDLRKYEEALDSFDRVIQIKFNFERAWYCRGVALSHLKRYEEAIITNNQAIEINPNYYEAWAGKGNALNNLGRYEESIASYDQAIKINPDDFKDWLNRGNVLNILGRYNDAIASYDQAIDINPNGEIAYFRRGCILQNLKRHDEAIASYNRAIGINPHNETSHFGKGGALFNSSRYEEALSAFNLAIKIKSDYHEAWLAHGRSLLNLDRHEESLFSLNRAIEFRSDIDEAWFLKSIALISLKRYEESLDSLNQVIKINPDHQKAWLSKGSSLGNLERYEEAVDCLDRAIKINPDYHDAWVNRGNKLGNLGRYEEALDSFDRAIKINPDLSLTYPYCYSRGAALGNLERYEESIIYYDLAIKIEPNTYQAWCNKGIALKKLGRYEKAIVCFHQALKIQPTDHLTWSNQGDTLAIIFQNKNGYKVEISSYNEAFEHIRPDIHPEGWGYLQHQIGSTHYKEGINQLFNHQCDPQPYYDRALTHYHNALQTLTREEFPKLRLETLIDTAKVYLAQHNTPAARQCKTEAFDILQDLLNAQTPEGKKRLQREYHSLSQLDVDLFIANGDNIKALRAAELEKNNRLTWLLTALSEKTISPSYVQMRQLLGINSVSTTIDIRGLDSVITLPLAKNSPTGIVYWHLSPDNLTTFILTANDSQPLVWEIDRRQQAQQLAKWIKEWDTQYRDYGSKNGSKKSTATQPSSNGEVIKDEKEHHPWRKNLPDYLAQLQQILEIDQICAQLPTTLTHLILIPHGDLHRFPLHTLFLASAKLPNLRSCTYLPSIQIGLNLQQRSNPTKSYTPLLSVEDPETHQDKMPFAQIESTIVRHLLEPNTHINSVSANLATVEDALKQPHASFHFTGHAAYNSRSPEASALALTDEPLTAKRISQLDLSSYNLITLAACETAITGRENINTEYVGLSSAFLQAEAANILSTLWQVDEIANAWFTIYFYQQLLSGKSPAEALIVTQRWLQTVTWQELDDWLAKFGSSELVDDYLEEEKEIFEKEGKIGLGRSTKYSHPYYWAAFTLTGQG